MENQKNSRVPQLIVFTFVAFAAFIGYMVYQAFQEDLNLVQEDYYQETMKHDEHVEDIKRSNTADVSLNYDPKRAIIQLELNGEFEGKDVVGELYFYRPSDTQMDFKIPISLTNNSQVYSTNEVSSGKWIVKVSFTYQNNNYFKETSFIK